MAGTPLAGTQYNRVWMKDGSASLGDNVGSQSLGPADGKGGGR